MKFDHAAFQVSDIDKSIEFYVEKLGFKLCFKDTDLKEKEVFAFLEIGDARIELLQDLAGKYDIPPVRKPYCPHFALEVQDMGKAVEMLKKNKINIIRGPLEIKGEETWIYFSDPDNNVLEFIQWYHKKEQDNY